ncbi:hypothetical protein [Nocardioides sp.]|uniref:hypothetical protein n=1 Tax=Nocardioides sp. TaxID=35761 RepID=UPI0037843F62
MKKRGVTRGLVAVVVSAMATVVLPLLAGPAGAEPISSHYAAGATVLLTSGADDRWDYSNDGQDTRVHLVAAVGADVQEVTFEYSQDGGSTWMPINRVAVADGVGQVFWAPAGLPGGPTTVRATGYAANNVVTGVPSTRTLSLQSTRVSIDIGNATASEIGLFQQPYGGVNRLLGAIAGTTSGPAVQSGMYNFGGVFTGIVGPADPAGIRPWTSVVAADGYDFSTDPDQLLVGAFAIDGSAASSDSESLTVYPATVASASIAATPSNLPNPPGGTATVAITVKDQKGSPLVGAQVVSPSADDQATGVTNGVASDHVVGYTNSLGQVTVAHPANTAGDKSYYYWVNTTGDTAYQDGTDYLRHVHIGSSVGVPSTVQLSSADGSAFDLDEYAAGDVRARALDQGNQDFAGSTVTYKWTVTPFDTTHAAWSASGKAGPTNAQGYVTVPLPAPGANDPDGTYGLTAYVDLGDPGQQPADPAATATWKAGQATPAWSDGTRKQFMAGSSPDVISGKLQLADGTVLPNRYVSIDYTHGLDEVGGAGSFSKIAAQADQPAGTNRISDTRASAPTDTGGVFEVALADPVTSPQGKETGADADAYFGPGPGTVRHAHLTVDFLRSSVPASITQVGGDTQLIGGEATPGRPVTDTYEVRSAEGDLLAGVAVTTTVDRGFFTPGKDGAGYAADKTKLVPVSTADGADYGVWRNIGNTTHVVTDNTGRFSVTRAIERDPGFDDDGMAVQTATLTAGAATLSDPVIFDTLYQGSGAADMPLNPGAMAISLAGAQESSILPDVRIDQSVGYRALATDSFGNLVQDEVSYSDDTTAAGLDHPGQTWDQTPGPPPVHSGNTPFVALSQLGGDTAAGVGAYSWTPDTTQSVQAQYRSGTQTWLDDPATVVVDPGVVTGAKTSQSVASPIRWYTVDWTASDLVLGISSDVTGTVPLGTPVRTTVEAVDQSGQPVAGLGVEFVRTGPKGQNGDYTDPDGTDADGTSVYDWIGAEAGTAQVTAYVFDTWGPAGEHSLVRKLVDEEITFERTPVSIHLKLEGSQDGNKDVIEVMAAPAAAGQRAVLYRNGEIVKTRALDSSGDHTFEVKDTNGTRSTKYTVKVAASDSTHAASKSIKIA